MSEVLSEYTFFATNDRSEFELYMDGRIHRIVAGQDFRARSRHNVDIAIRALARNKGLRIKIRCESHDPLILVVQAIAKQQPKQEALT